VLSVAVYCPLLTLPFFRPAFSCDPGAGRVRFYYIHTRADWLSSSAELLEAPQQFSARLLVFLPAVTVLFECPDRFLRSQIATKRLGGIPAATHERRPRIPGSGLVSCPAGGTGRAGGSLILWPRLGSEASRARFLRSLRLCVHSLTALSCLPCGRLPEVAGLLPSAARLAVPIVSRTPSSRRALPLQSLLGAAVFAGPGAGCWLRSANTSTLRRSALASAHRATC